MKLHRQRTAVSDRLAGQTCSTDSEKNCPPETPGRTPLRRGDRVRFRSNSTIAAKMGIDPRREFVVGCTACNEAGKRYAILRLGGSSSDVAIPVGQLAVVHRRDAEVGARA